MITSSNGFENIVEKRENLYTTFEEKSANLGRNCIFQRIVIISRIKNPLKDYSVIGNKYQNFLKESAQQLQTELPTGFLLIQLKHAIHIIEGPMKVIMMYMRELLSNSEAPDSIFDVSKVIVLSHDIVLSHYQSFHWKEVDIEVVDTDFKKGENDEKLVIDLLKQVNDIGIYIMKTPNKYVELTLKEMFTKNTNFVPSQGVISYLLKEDIDCISTLQQMLGQYDDIYDFETPSDSVWPLPTRKYPYTTLF